MNNACQIKRGFFVMRSCPAPVVKQCTKCQRYVCQHHLADSSETAACVECAGKTSDEYYDDFWIYSYRDQYYHQGYKPFKYTDEDYESFEDYDFGVDDWDDDYAGDFHDS